MPAALAWLMTERILVPKMFFAVALVEQRGQVRHGFHQMDAVFLLGQTLVHFQKRHDAFHVPKIIRGGLAFDVAVHRALKQDRAEDPVAVETGAGDDARAHLMDQREHLFFRRTTPFALMP